MVIRQLAIIKRASAKSWNFCGYVSNVLELNSTFLKKKKKKSLNFKKNHSIQTSIQSFLLLFLRTFQQTGSTILFINRHNPVLRRQERPINRFSLMELINFFNVLNGSRSPLHFAHSTSPRISRGKKGGGFEWKSRGIPRKIVSRFDACPWIARIANNESSKDRRRMDEPRCSFQSPLESFFLGPGNILLTLPDRESEEETARWLAELNEWIRK